MAQHAKLTLAIRSRNDFAGTASESWFCPYTALDNQFSNKIRALAQRRAWLLGEGAEVGAVRIAVFDTSTFPWQRQFVTFLDNNGENPDAGTQLFAKPWRPTYAGVFANSDGLYSAALRTAGVASIQIYANNRQTRSNLAFPPLIFTRDDLTAVNVRYDLLSDRYWKDVKKYVQSLKNVGAGRFKRIYPQAYPIVGGQSGDGTNLGQVWLKGAGPLAGIIEGARVVVLGRRNKRGFGKLDREFNGNRTINVVRVDTSDPANPLTKLSLSCTLNRVFDPCRPAGQLRTVDATFQALIDMHVLLHGKPRRSTRASAARGPVAVV